MDHQQWHNLVMQLEDLLVVQCLLKMKPGHETLSKSSTNPEPIVVSLKRVLDGGKGLSHFDCSNSNHRIKVLHCEAIILLNTITPGRFSDDLSLHIML